MRVWLGVSIRLVVAVAMGLTLVAIYLGHLDRPRPVKGRRIAAPRFQPLDDALFPDTSSALRVLDLEAGTIRLIPLADGGRLMRATSSPWRDGQGREQVIGAWKSAARSRPRAVGVARYVVPAGEVIDQFEMADAVPGSPPCWFLDATSRILFAAQDGFLYQMTFEPTEWARGDAEVSRPRKLTWPLDWSMLGFPQFSEPVWPTDPRMEKRLIVTLTFPDREVLERGEPRAQLWWVRLKHDGSAIVKGGRLIDSGRRAGRGLETWGDEMVREEHLASVSTTVDGRLVLAYLVRRGERRELELMLAPLTIDATTGTPRVNEDDAVTIARNRAFTPPAFSSDHRWLYSFTAWPPGPVTLERASVLENLSETSPESKVAVLLSK